MIGRTISHYKITEKLSEGGMGVAYKADAINLQQSLAPEPLRSDVVQDDEDSQCFLSSPRAAAGLTPANVLALGCILSDQFSRQSVIVLSKVSHYRHRMSADADFTRRRSPSISLRICASSPRDGQRLLGSSTRACGSIWAMRC